LGHLSVRLVHAVDDHVLFGNDLGKPIGVFIKFLKVSPQPKAAVEPGARHGSTVSRRELQAIVAMARHDLNALHRQNPRRIHWNVPNVAWAMDPCEYGQRDAAGDNERLYNRYRQWKSVTQFFLISES
jgi:hypothetical protein